MTIKTLYTAIGHFEHRTNGCGRSFPVIVLGGNEYMMDLQEMVIWAALNWRIARREEIGILYQNACKGAEHTVVRSWDECVERLLTRGLLISGSGNTEYDALYDLLASLYIVPVSGSLPMRLLSFLHLTLLKRVPVSAARRLFQTDKRTKDEAQVMKLARQALLSTAEIIKCVEKGIFRLPDETSILAGLYDDKDTTSDNISCLVKSASHTKEITLAVANLYLRQQIIFERI